ncbi:MAG: hypothetical protein ACSLFQ_15040 [Thermoanaerobaculia bacterium]
MRLARSILVLVLLFSSTLRAAKPPVADASPTAPGGGVVLSLVETVRQHRLSVNLSEVCRVGFRVRGCTDFPREELDCRCELRNGDWVIEGTAHVEAVIHLGSGPPINDVLLHERAHIGHLEVGLRAHLDWIRSLKFDSRPSCDGYARVLTESLHLREVMNGLRIESNAKYGCDRKGRF